MKKLHIIIYVFCLLLDLSSCEDSYFIKIKEHKYFIEFKDTETASQIKSKLPFTVKMKNLNGNEVYHQFDEDFKKNEKSIDTINTGDIYLYQSDYLVLFYKTFSTSYKYTQIGKLKNPTGLENDIGSDDVLVYWCMNDCTDKISSNSSIKVNLYLSLIFILFIFI